MGKDANKKKKKDRNKVLIGMNEIEQMESSLLICFEADYCCKGCRSTGTKQQNRLTVASSLYGEPTPLTYRCMCCNNRVDGPDILPIYEKEIVIAAFSKFRGAAVCSSCREANDLALMDASTFEAFEVQRLSIQQQTTCVFAGLFAAKRTFCCNCDIEVFCDELEGNDALWFRLTVDNVAAKRRSMNDGEWYSGIICSECVPLQTLREARKDAVLERIPRSPFSCMVLLPPTADTPPDAICQLLSPIVVFCPTKVLPKTGFLLQSGRILMFLQNPVSTWCQAIDLIVENPNESPKELNFIFCHNDFHKKVQMSAVTFVKWLVASCFDTSSVVDAALLFFPSERQKFEALMEKARAIDFTLVTQSQCQAAVNVTLEKRIRGLCLLQVNCAH